MYSINLGNKQKNKIKLDFCESHWRKEQDPDPEAQTTNGSSGSETLCTFFFWKV